MSAIRYAPPEWTEREIAIELIGCGGTGSSMLDELYRMHALLVRLDHPGLQIRAWDGDTVSEANVGRQRFWPCDVGYNKAELLVTRYASFGEVDWQFESRPLERGDCERLATDLIVSCVDSAECRVMIGEVGRDGGQRNSLWLDTGNDRDSGQVILGDWYGPDVQQEKQQMRLPNVLDLYPSLVEERSDNRPSCSSAEAIRMQDFGINQRLAIEASGLLWRLIRYGSIERHGSFVYQAHGEVLPLSIDANTWSSFAA